MKILTVNRRSYHAVFACMKTIRKEFGDMSILRPIIDRVGGGDAFSGGLIHGLLTKKTMGEALEFAVAAGAVTTRSETSSAFCREKRKTIPTSSGALALDQFVGKSGAGSLVVKQNIDAVTGATVSTKGVTKGVNAALAAAEAMN